MQPSFKLVTLGSSGGPFEDRGSGYLLAPLGSNAFIALDGGSLLGGIQEALEMGQLDEVPLYDEHLSPIGVFFQRYVVAYLISHPHLDHVLGLIVNSQVDGKKRIFGSDFTIDNIRDHLFNGTIWPNCGDEGEGSLHQYTYVRLKSHLKVSIPETEMSVEAFPLSHSRGYTSTAFLIESGGEAIVYFGDTGSDLYEQGHCLEKIWDRLAPLVRADRLHALILECSYSAEEGHALYGHLNSSLFLRELHRFQEIAKTPLSSLNVVVTHRKSALEKGPGRPALIADELRFGNDLNCHLFFPECGDRLIL